MPCSEKYFHKPCPPLPFWANRVLRRQSATHGGVQREGQPKAGPGRGSVALSASGVQTGHSAGADSQPASAWGQASHEASFWEQTPHHAGAGPWERCPQRERGANGALGGCR